MGSAMNSSIAMIEGRIKAMNVLCGTGGPPVRLCRLKLMAPGQLRPPRRGLREVLEEAAFLGRRGVSRVDVGERLGRIFLARDEVREFGRQRRVEETHIRG